MIEVFKFEAEDEEACRLKCLDELDVYNNEILVKELEVESGYSMEVIKKEDVKSFIKGYLEKVSKEMGIDLKLEINEYEDVFTVTTKVSNFPLTHTPIGKIKMFINGMRQFRTTFEYDKDTNSINWLFVPDKGGFDIEDSEVVFEYDYNRELEQEQEQEEEEVENNG